MMWLWWPPILPRPPPMIHADSPHYQSLTVEPF